MRKEIFVRYLDKVDKVSRPKEDARKIGKNGESDRE